MALWDLFGYVAATLVLAAFYMRDMVPLRVTALCSSLAFIAYGLALGLLPIWLLHPPPTDERLQAAPGTPGASTIARCALIRGTRRLR